MNEKTAETTDLYTIDSGTAAFTSAGGLYMPVIGQQVTFTSPNYILGHTYFPITEAVMAGGTIGNYDITYAIDKNNGSGYSAFKNLYYPRAGGGGASSSTNVTMTSTTGVAVGDYVFGTNIAPNAKVASITNSTTVVVDIANIGTVSGVLRFTQLPSETSIDASLGFKLQVRILTSTTNATAITSLYCITDSTSTSRAYQYSLETVSVTITVLDINTSLPIENARVFLETSPGGVDIFNTLTDVDGIVQDAAYAFTSNQAVTGRVRKATGEFYKTAPIVGTITSAGFDQTIFLIPDT
jgi:hypothetical protein